MFEYIFICFFFLREIKIIKCEIYITKALSILLNNNVKISNKTHGTTEIF